MTSYPARLPCERFQQLCVFFLAALIFSIEGLAAQNVSGLTPEESLQKRAEFIDAALAYRGTPYAYGGDTRRGMDCSGLIWRAGMEGPGISLPRTAVSLSEYVQRISDSELEPGDLVFFNTTGRISHVGIYLGDEEFLHSASSGPQTGVMVSKLTDSYWRRTYRFSGRIFPSAASASTASSSASEDSPAAESAPAVPSPAPATSPPPASAATPPKKRSSSYGLRVEFRGTALWDFNIDENLIRGVTASATAQWRGRANFYPGLTAGFTWDTHQDTMSVPLYISATAQNGLAFFAGAQFIFYSGGEGSTEIFFPGIIGVSWTSPYKSLGSVKIGFYQSIECVFVRKEGVAGRMLDDVFRLATGVSFAIGK